MDNDITKNIDGGDINICDDVVGVIAGVTALEVQGVSSMSAGITSGIADLLGKKNLNKGVKVQVNENVATIDIFIIVEYGSKIPDVALAVQQKVKGAIETMTGINIDKVNVHVEGVNMQPENKI